MNYLILLCSLIAFEASGTILHKWVYNEATTGTSPVPDSINPNNENYKMTLLEGAKITSGGLECNGGYGKTAGSIPQYGTISHTLEARVKFTGEFFAVGSSPLALDSNYNPTNGAYGHRQFDAIVNNEISSDHKWIAGSDYFRRTRKVMTGNGVVAEALDEWIHIMISYNVEDELVTIYRNGEQYGDSYKPTGGFMNINDQVRAMACIRHLRTASLIGTIAYAAIHEGAKTPADVTNDEWIEIASEAVGNDGTDKWRYLDFGSEIYAKHPEITEYKLEWGAKYENVVVFELGGAHSNHHIFENTPDSINPNIKINILESNVQGLPVATDQYFCKACASSYGTKPGDTCWGILDKSDTNRQCGCNSGSWTGNGAYYGGWIPGQCNQCSCWGGAFTGYKGNGQQKGTISSVGLRLSIKVPARCSDKGVFLSDLKVSADLIGWNDGGPKGDGVNSWFGHTTMLMGNGQTYNNFLVIHPPRNDGFAYKRYTLNGDYSRFSAVVGVARSSNGCERNANYGSFRVDIVIDNVVRYTRTGYDYLGDGSYDDVDIDVSGANVLEIRTYRATDDYFCDHPAIANPLLSRCRRSGAYSKPGLFLENLSSDSSGISMYWMYTIAILLFINVICFAVYWCKCGKSSHQYKVVSVDSN